MWNTTPEIAPPRSQQIWAMGCISIVLRAGKRRGSLVRRVHRASKCPKKGKLVATRCRRQPAASSSRPTTSAAEWRPPEDPSSSPGAGRLVAASIASLTSLVAASIASLVTLGLVTLGLVAASIASLPASPASVPPPLPTSPASVPPPLPASKVKSLEAPLSSTSSTAAAGCGGSTRPMM